MREQRNERQDENIMYQEPFYDTWVECGQSTVDNEIILIFTKVILYK